LIACLGWGSLIWRPDNLRIEDEWLRDGPELPVEFTRVSRGTLVLIHDARPVAVLWAAMAVADLDEAIESLATREGIVNENIRCSIVVWSAGRVSRHIEREVIAEWARAKNITAVVWTALKPGPANNRGQPMTLVEAIEHLRRLRGAEWAAAKEYIRRAPAQIRTAYRAAFECEFGWRPLGDPG
jgi:hypothetical protein